jgi:Fanconi-associated nuclease 1
MWPVLFHPVPGAFETAYQTAPLDLGEDTFSRARRDMMEARLDEMQDTATALAMLRDTDARERPRGTWAVGLSWEFGAQELQEIAECMGGHALVMVCRMLGEDYRHRASGVPDLM